jgi:hypothetical protein
MWHRLGLVRTKAVRQDDGTYRIFGPRNPTLFGGCIPCCAKRFKATPPARLEPGSPFAPNLRFTQAISFERLLSRLRGDIGRSRSDGTPLAYCDGARHAPVMRLALGLAGRLARWRAG